MPARWSTAASAPRPTSYATASFPLLLDLDELEELDRSLKLFGHNRRAVFNFDDRDHGSGERSGLKDWVRGQLEAAGLWSPGMRIAVLCYPRVFGYVFNPLTVYFCRTAEGELRAVLYEVSNTFKERHTYVIPAGTGRDGQFRHECAKEMYVSPFLPMDCRYRFRIAPPSYRVLIAINESDPDGPLLHASFAGPSPSFERPHALQGARDLSAHDPENHGRNSFRSPAAMAQGTHGSPPPGGIEPRRQHRRRRPPSRRELI